MIELKLTPAPEPVVSGEVLTPGQAVKLRFTDGVTGERLWVRVEGGPDDSGLYNGKTDSECVSWPALRPGSPVLFTTAHVWQVLLPE